MEQEKASAGSRKRRINISVSTTSVLTLVMLIIAAMTTAYIWGVMTGRAGSAAKPGPLASGQPALPAAPPDELGRILQAHELGFTRALRGQKPLAPAAASEAVPEAPAETAARAVAEPAAEQQPAAQAPAPANVQAEPAGAAVESGVINDYLFQVAALRDEQACDNLRQKLEGYGLRTRMEHSGKVYIVLIAMRGNEDRVRELARIAAELRLGAPLLRSRKPVSP
ncbi:MAG: hypothetical protein HDQ44_00560 [Desulfovibrio sp.]|nr:hypothetical protein [Desulfovibrio sp.]